MGCRVQVVGFWDRGGVEYGSFGHQTPCPNEKGLGFDPPHLLSGEDLDSRVV